MAHCDFDLTQVSSSDIHCLVSQASSDANNDTADWLTARVPHVHFMAEDVPKTRIKRSGVL